ncbi:MAG: ribose-phosphate diphosphokinase [Candidatus Poseidoniia archaeon]|jgi:ribose-phosphate pyrophosphokinase|nr:ribose-phosphate diphosphokinase [Candidatus Poseidoniia archaeon]MDP7081796.1 ribose-phosphate diphosphokinase [Candidatus Poseidoniia archaeon]MDP7255407.1 ribose-phosphate diphosphokinase [Candidatus Poseidoniia archaeon]HJO28031.1 ribose-phosphate diphosphokinase [Candidatus Poseidoniia archaeon]
MFVVSGSTHQRLGVALAQETGAEFCGVINKRFPDGERYVRVLRNVAGHDVAVVQNTFPDESIVELLLILEALSESGAKSITTIIPYMGYARQERTFQRGEAISARAIARPVGALSDRVFTVSVHTDEVLSFFGCPTQDIDGLQEAVRYLKGFKPGLVVAPDEGAREWCARAAKELKAPLHVMSKIRVDDRTVETDSGKVKVKGLTVVILDDIISTGGTIASAARLLKNAGAGQVLAACTHGLFIEDAANRLRVCDDILSSDTLEGVYTRYSIAPAIAAAL